jgi:transcriptional regulator with XRE-family HTH domain
MIKTLGQSIRERRIELGLTQEELAERIGDSVRQAEISRLERDHITLPRRARLEQIARALDIPIGVLLSHSGWAGAENIQVLTVASDPEAHKLKAEKRNLEARNQALEAAVEHLAATTEELAAQTRTLEALLVQGVSAQDYLRTIFDGVEDGVVVVNGEGSVVFQNAAYLQILERHGADLLLTDDKGQPLLEESDPLRRAASGEEFTMNVSTTGNDCHGSYIAHAKPMKTDSGELLGVVTLQNCEDPE